ncbi:hypothetical protein ENUP19_0047G0078 [Entamoeba nuttalli]|uniref:Leucine rich repeat protein, BspA family protein n=2 Tax=Entamoeba nuttalli TaxID=412467 RepID=K2I0Z5_ENTNP|nr:leucine rich repeat protein, BspA family protein [Entamoeba nuttalli P19]EKE42425.1 leucine rich repeat protein, BspA family protein [Entamoeba nuttalli P19]|eukprot:XP_008855242.1 leucine rich repeat protein, BspA family protein [Entamoeba nuttalli P19]
MIHNTLLPLNSIQFIISHLQKYQTLVNCIFINKKWKHSIEYSYSNPFSLSKQQLLLFFPHLVQQNVYHCYDDRIINIPNVIWYYVPFELVEKNKNISHDYFKRIEFTLNDKQQYNYNSNYHVHSLASHLFENNHQLESIQLPSSLLRLEHSVFSHCNLLHSISINSPLQTIGQYCFSMCTSLCTIKLPASLSVLEEGVFSHCSSLKCLDLSMLSLQILNKRTFEYCTNLSSVILPLSLQKIEEDCFYNCISLSTLCLPSTLTFIGTRCFYECTSLSRLDLPSTISTMTSSDFTRTDTTQHQTQFCCWTEDFYDVIDNLESEIEVEIRFGIGKSCFYHCNFISKIFPSYCFDP